MNLKEAFRFQNKLNSFLVMTQHFLSQEGNVTQTETTYLHRKVMSEAENETVVSEFPSPFCHHIDGVVGFALHLLQEKEKLSQAISAAKAALPLDMDSQTALNGCRQNLARTLEELAGLRASEVTVPNGGTGYRFNAEGNQVSYRCDIRRVTTIHFDRNKLRKQLAHLNRQAEEVSAALDRAVVNSKVDYTVPFDVNARFEDVLEAYLGIA